MRCWSVSLGGKTFQWQRLGLLLMAYCVELNMISRHSELLYVVKIVDIGRLPVGAVNSAGLRVSLLVDSLREAAGPQL